jgi:DnaJ-class molecular chaperone
MSMGNKMNRAEALEMLGLREGCSQEDVRSAYKRLSHQVHPDTGGNATLFRLVRQAYDVLMNDSAPPPRQDSAPKSQSQPKDKQQEPENKKDEKPQQLSWQACIRQSDFELTFEQLSDIATLGRPAKVPYTHDGIRYDLTITPESLEKNFIRCSFPVEVTIKSYKNFFFQLFHHPQVVKTSSLRCRNCFGASRVFRHNIMAHCPKGRHEVIVELLGRTFRFTARTGRSHQTTVKSKHLSLPGKNEITVDLNVSITQKA